MTRSTRLINSSINSSIAVAGIAVLSMIGAIGCGGGEGDLSRSPVVVKPEVCGGTQGSTFVSAGATGTPRYQPSVVRLADGRVLIAGGSANFRDQLTSAEIYDPATGQFTPTGGLNIARGAAAAALLLDGRVLLAGGYPGPTGEDTLSSAEIYDPNTGTFTLTGKLYQERLLASGTLLPDGRVLVCGGWATTTGGVTGINPLPNEQRLLTSCEAYNPSSGAFTTVAPLPVGRNRHAAVLLNNGKVLLAGGHSWTQGMLKDAYLFDPGTNQWTKTDSMKVGRRRFAMTLLLDGRVLVTGGFDNTTQTNVAELYDPSNGKFSKTGDMPTPRDCHAATLLDSGAVLVAGGYNDAQGFLGNAELWIPGKGNNAKWQTTGAMSVPRELHNLVTLLDGRVLAVGGHDPAAPLSAAELYTPPCL